MISNYIQRQRRQHATITALSCIAGAAMMIFGAYTIVSDVNAELPEKDFSAAVKQHCQEAARSVNLIVNEKGRNLEVRGYSIKEPLFQLSQTSLVIQQCQGYELKEFCMGSGCSGSPISFTLQHKQG